MSTPARPEGCTWSSCGRPFPCGERCDDHTPRALRGLPEIPPGPGWPRDQQQGGAGGEAA